MTSPLRWRVSSRVDHPDPGAANALVLDEFEGGADGLTLVSAGAPGDRGFGLNLATPKDLDTLFDGVALDLVALRLDPGPDACDLAGWLAALIEDRGHDPAALDLDFGLDPAGLCAARGGPAIDRAGMLYLAVRTAADLWARGFAGPVLRADGRLWHAAGASEAQELAAVLAAGVLYLRELEAGGVPLDRARATLSFALTADADLVATVAKFRALRRLWAAVGTACGLDPAPIRLHGETDWRGLSAASPHTNVIRGAIACFAAAVAGADGITVLPFSLPLGLPGPAARRLARNTQHVLAEESHLWRVADPAAGAEAFEAATGALCREAWASFQEIEREGGLAESLAAGRLQQRVATVRERRQRDLTDGRAILVGATQFRAEDDAPPDVLPVRPETRGSVAGSLGSQRLAASFETFEEHA